MQGVTRFVRSLLGVLTFIVFGSLLFVLGGVTTVVLVLLGLSGLEDDHLYKVVMLPVAHMLDLANFCFDKLAGPMEA